MNAHRIVLTGATGFVGSHMLRDLLKNQWDTLVVARTSSDLSWLKTHYPQVKVVFWDHDIAEFRKQIVEFNPSHILHLATLFLVQHEYKQIPQLVESNILLGNLMLDCAKECDNVRFVSTGTAWQYDLEGNVSPTNLYAATKQALFSISQYYAQFPNIDIIWLQLFDTFGPFDPRKKLVAHLKNAADSGVSMELSPGEQVLDLMYILDVVHALNHCLTTLPKSKQDLAQVFALAHPERLSLKGIVKQFEQGTGKSVPAKWGARPYRDNEVMNPWIPQNPLPNWKPQFSLVEAFKDMDFIEQKGPDNYWSL